MDFCQQFYSYVYNLGNQRKLYINYLRPVQPFLWNFVRQFILNICKLLIWLYYTLNALDTIFANQQMLFKIVRGGQWREWISLVGWWVWWGLVSFLNFNVFWLIYIFKTKTIKNEWVYLFIVRHFWGNYHFGSTKFKKILGLYKI